MIKPLLYVITLLLLSFMQSSVQASSQALHTDVEILKQSATISLNKWQALQQAINIDNNNSIDNQKVIAALRIEYQQAVTEELTLFDRLVEAQAQHDYQVYLAERVFDVEHRHHCKRMSSQQECAEKARISALDKAGKQGSSIVINSTTDITTTRIQTNDEVENSSEFKEQTNMQAFTNVTSYKIIESYKLKGSNEYERLWFIKLSVTVSAKQNDYYYQQLVKKYKQRLKIYLSQNDQLTAADGLENQSLDTERYTETVNEISFEMVKLPDGKFLMGSEHGEYNETPLRVMTVSSFYIAQAEVTKALYAQCIKSKHCNGKWKQTGKLGIEEFNHPQVNVSWYDIQQEFIPWLVKKTGKAYRLPTEVEWEFAARAGKQSEYHYGNRADQICLYANGAKAKDNNQQCDDGFVKTLAPIKQFQPNLFGLYDMSGNVSEWTSACWSNYGKQEQDCSQAMIRGGSWYSQPFYLRLASRVAKNKSTRLDTLGFRLAYSE